MWHLPDPHRTDASPGRPRWRRMTALAATSTAGVVVLAACGGGGGNTGGGGNGGEGNGGGGNGGALSNFKSNGITVGYAGEKPYDFKNSSGKVTGMAPAVGRKILGNLGISKISFKKVDFNSLIPGLKSSRFDMTMAAASITPDRAKSVAYTDPVYCVKEALGVKKGNPKNLSDYKSIKKSPKVKLAVESGATELTYAQKIGIPKSQLVTVSDNAALVQSVKTGRADAFSLTETTVQSLVKRSGGGELMALKGFNPVVGGVTKLSCGAPQFRKDETALTKAYNQQLHKLQQNDQVYSVVKQASSDGKAFGFTKKQFQDAKQYTVKKVVQILSGKS